MNPLLLSSHEPAVERKPFVHLQIDDFLPKDIYESALRDFPTRDWFVEQIEGNKLRFSTKDNPSVVEDLVQKFPVWGQIIEWMSDGEFIQTLKASLKPRWSRSITTEFEFSRLESGAFVPAHTDSIYKLVSVLLYFPPSGWDASYGGDTVFYKAKASNWSNRRLPVDSLQPFFTAHYKPNTFVAFVKSANSHHSVSPINCPEGITRNSLNFNIYASPKGDVGFWTRNKVEVAKEKVHNAVLA